MVVMARGIYTFGHIIFFAVNSSSYFTGLTVCVCSVYSVVVWRVAVKQRQEMHHPDWLIVFLITGAGRQ